MAKANSTQPAIISGFKPLTIPDVANALDEAYAQAELMRSLFNVLARLAPDDSIKQLCEHGANQAAIQANEIDFINERARKAGFVAEAAQ